MKSLSNVEIQFFELSLLLKKELTATTKSNIIKTLLKLNNPTYYGKFMVKHPIERQGYKAPYVMNPVLQSISNMLKASKEVSDLKILSIIFQKEISWAFHKHPSYSLVDL